MAGPEELSRRHISPQITAFFEGLAKGETYLEEAEFGLQKIIPMLDALPAGSRVLEIGSGPCIVLAEITQRYPSLNICGVEPMSDGFAFFEGFIKRLEASQLDIQIHRTGYEDFEGAGHWDLIFLVNVFEHLPDWRDFLSFVQRSLTPTGQCIILCPNYGFPYESHFRLPIIGNKKLTGRVFRNHIEQLELKNDCRGLFQSLNFVKLSQMRVTARKLGLNLAADTSIVAEMIDRLDSDPAFQERQKIMAVPAKALKRSGLLNVMLRSPLVQNYLPYMQILVSRKS